MKITKTLVALATVAALTLGASACSSDPKTESKDPASESSKPGVEGGADGSEGKSKDAEGQPGAENTPAAPPEKGLDKGKKNEKIKYTDPSQAGDYCGVFKDLDKLAAETASQASEKSNEQIGERYEIMSRTAGKLSDYAEGDSEKKQWKAMSDDTMKVSDFFKSTGGNTENTDFLFLVGKAYESTSTAYRAQEDKVKKECGVDLSKYLVEGDDRKASDK